MTSISGQLELVHDIRVRARRGDVLPPQEDRQGQVRKTATDGLSPRSRAGGCIDRRVEGAQTALVMHADNRTPIFEFLPALNSST